MELNDDVPPQGALDRALSVEFELTREDIARYATYAIWRLPQARNGSLLRLALAAVTAAVFYALMHVPPIPAAIMVALATAIYVPIYIRQTRARMIRRSKDLPGCFEPRTVEIGAGGVRETFAGGTVSLQWSAIKDVRVSRDQVMLFIAPMHALIVPLRAFESASAAKHFVLSAHDYWQANRLPGGHAPVVTR